MHIILHLPAEFGPNWTILDRVMMSCPFFKIGSHGIAILLPVSVFGDFGQMGRLTSICIEKFWSDISTIGRSITTSSF